MAQWKRVCLLSRRSWVRSPPGSCFILYHLYLIPHSIYLLYRIFFIPIFFLLVIYLSFVVSFSSSFFSLSFSLFFLFFLLCISFILYIRRQGWPSGPRRQFKVLFSSEAWVRTPLLAFLLTLSNFFHLRFLLFPFISQGLLAQSAVRSPSKGKVVGSIPAGALA